MWSIIKTVGSYLSVFETAEVSENVKEINDILEEDEDDPISDFDLDSKRISSHMFGKVTHIYEDHGLIDGKIYFDLNNTSRNFQVGDCVQFVAFKMAENEEWRVTNMFAINYDLWEEERSQKKKTVVRNHYGNAQLSSVNDGDMKSQTPMFRSHVGKVSQRYGRDIIISPGDVRCNLDQISSEFLPLAGDYVQLDVIYTTDGFTETIIKLDNLKPLRSKPYLGHVTHWEPSQQAGIISHEIYFSKDVCEPGFIPIIGDEVIADVLESDQGGLVWRAIQVLPASVETQRLPSAPRNKSDLNLLLQNKEGIFIREITDVGQVELGKEKTLEIELENGNSKTHVLKSCAFCFKNSTPQFVLLHPLIQESLEILPNTSVTFVFTAKARFVGKSDEVFVWTFEGFSIGRQLKIEVQDPKTERIMQLNSKCRQKGKNNRHSVTAKKLMATRNGFVVPGVRPIKPPSFVPVSLGMFKVPERLINAVLGAGNKQRHEIEIRTYLCQGFPCLEGPLTPEVYRDRWHTLLYLEEIQNMIDTSMHDITHATFTRSRGSYLSLEIPGLAEKRPSLVVGDKVVVRKAWDESDWRNIYTELRSGGKSTMYEGYIHRVLNEEILIKFGPSFHDSYSGDYSVNFLSGRMNFRRFHQAINVAVSHLDTSWLFPSSVTYQAAQMVLEEDTSCEDYVSDNGLENPIVENSELENIAILNTHVNGGNSELNNSLSDNDLQINNETKQNNLSTKDVDPTGTDKFNHNQELNSDPVHLKPSKAEEKFKWNSTSKLKMGKQEVSRIYFPHGYKKKISWFNKKLNSRQRQAVKYILCGEARPLPYVIFGPPGTGKTITLVEAALQILTLLPDSRLLIATPSNSAADLIAERLLDSDLFSTGMLLRLVSHHYAQDSRLPSHLIHVCGMADMKPRDEYDSEPVTQDGIPIKSLSREDIGRHRVTIGTCTALGILYNLGFPEGHFTHILIDEAGQATEPEVLIPLAFLHMAKGQAILAGDPLQLGPVVISNLAGDMGLSESLLARLLRRSLYCRDMIGFPETGGYNPLLITRLVNNYRSLPEIINLPSMMFYDGDLVPLISEINSEEADVLCKLNDYLSLPLREGSTLPPAVIFHGVRGSNTQSPESPSWYNPQEAVQAGHYLEQAYECGLTIDDIGVVTPYQKQASKIRETLETSELPVPKVGSVEEFQGQERMMIILSTVRSNMKLIHSDVTHSLGFVASPRRLNVALTRARALLIIIGDPHLLSFDNYWRTVLTYCVKRNAYIGCDLPLNIAEVGNNVC